MSVYYLGYPISRDYVPPVVFTTDCGDPTWETHGDTFVAVVGPFRTKRAAIFMQTYGRSNPHCRTVAEAEALAKKYAK